MLYFTVTDSGKLDRLVGVDAPIADRAEVHENLSEGGVMKMRAAEGIAVAPGQTLVMKPGGYHVMLFGLQQALNAGDSFPVAIRFTDGGKVNAVAKVAKAGAMTPDDHTTIEHSQGMMKH